ncbi:MAG: OmpA family protein [Saprospiraceae bacterium]|nr:OmpA family protein [Saprospiraceae bacterium]HMX89185.1 OmpA family protein [Saprospiraceae bacterium]HMZ40594.1 OmpA family protein [Saprospiraceae bacterium]HNB31278.1 OmpA family protein [Saprospiraceae bacterium]HNC35781.1 OmpA family protein [Saprospiraceae bacterium]
MKQLLALTLISLSVLSCVSSKKYKLALAESDALRQSLTNCRQDLGSCQNTKDELGRTSDARIKELNQGLSSRNEKIKGLEEQIDFLKKNNNNLLERLSDLSVVSKAGAESIKKSLEAMNEKDRYIKDLTQAVSRKDSINLALVMNLKKSLGDLPSEDVNIEVRKGVVYVSLSDQMLFKSGSATINEKAAVTIEKIAKIINDQKDIDILIEGHTDNVPINTDCLADNWDLSTKRATTIARLLQRKYNVDPARITAGGRSEYLPKTSNDTEQGRRINRRTELIILPRLDQFFELASPAGQ